jgi:1,2-diacylglycerol 3-alpha-glucosyltransferase
VIAPDPGRISFLGDIGRDQRLNILMLTNTYVPHVGGVARSVSGLVAGLRERGHSVLVVAPEFPGTPDAEEGVERIVALQRFGGSDFSMPLPLTWPLSEVIEDFAPDLVHTHHPFLLGDTALRVASVYQVPIIFTYHTRYELYGHYIAQDSAWLQRLVLSLAHGYCDLCDHVIAPSQSIVQHLKRHGVQAPMTVIPTGIDVDAFASGRRDRARERWNLAPDQFVIGHVGRLAPEKNLDILVQAMAEVLVRRPKAAALITGDGSYRSIMEHAFAGAGLAERVRFTGVLTGEPLWDAYAAQDVFAFTSISETQGLVLTEAMAAGVPVIALDAPGAREVVEDGSNGRLLPHSADADALAKALAWLADLPLQQREAMKQAARQTAGGFSTTRCLDRVLELYESVLEGEPKGEAPEASAWEFARRRLESELDIVANIAHAVSDAVLLPPDQMPSDSAER